MSLLYVVQGLYGTYPTPGNKRWVTQIIRLSPGNVIYKSCRSCWPGIHSKCPERRIHIVVRDMICPTHVYWQAYTKTVAWGWSRAIITALCARRVVRLRALRFRHTTYPGSGSLRTLFYVAKAVTIVSFRWSPEGDTVKVLPPTRACAPSPTRSPSSRA